VFTPATGVEGERPRILATLGAGEVFGDLAYLDGAPRSADVIALSDVHLFVLTPDDVRRAARFDGLETLLAARLAIAIGDRLRRATGEARRLRDA
jgi:CRP-like cAMP-binding protein